MEKPNNLPTRTGSGVRTTSFEVSKLAELPEREKSILKAVGQVNKLVGYQVDLTEIADWCRDLDRLAPEIEPERLSFLMDCYKTDKLQWDRSMGIQNIFRALKLVDVENGKYILLKPIF